VSFWDLRLWFLSGIAGRDFSLRKSYVPGTRFLMSRVPMTLTPSLIAKLKPCATFPDLTADGTSLIFSCESWPSIPPPRGFLQKTNFLLGTCLQLLCLYFLLKPSSTQNPLALFQQYHEGTIPLELARPACAQPSTLSKC
jgi:hypothetical protein